MNIETIQNPNNFCEKQEISILTIKKAGTRGEPFLEAKERFSIYGLENWEEEKHRKGRRKNK
jgi:hypothetical protein